MKCPRCGYESPWTNYEVFSASNGCISCGFDNDGVEFYGEATSESIKIEA